MTPEQVAAVEESWASLRPRLPELAARFYTELFAAHPGLREMFPADLAQQQAKFALELDTLVTAIPDFPAFRARAASLGQRHRSYGVLPRQYVFVREALLAALAAAAAPDVTWSRELDDAWRQAYDLVAEVMMSSPVGTGA